MSGYPYYPYSVILDVPNNKYATGQIPNKPVYRRETRAEAVKAIIEQSIQKLKNLSAEQENLFMLAKEEAPERVKQILEGRVTILDAEEEIQSIITILDEAKKIDKSTITLMDLYKRKMDEFMKEVYERIKKEIGRKFLTQEALRDVLQKLLQDYQKKDSLMAGIVNQTITALNNAPEKTIQLFRQIPKEKIELYKRKGVSVQEVLKKMIQGQTQTIDGLIKKIQEDEITRKEFLQELICLIKTDKEQDSNFIVVDKLTDEELMIILTQKLFQDSANFFQSAITIKTENPKKGKRQQRQHSSPKTGFDAIEILCSFGNPLINPEDIERGAVQLFQTGKLTTRKTARLTFSNLSESPGEKTGLQIFLDDLGKQKSPRLEITTTFRADKPDDIASFITKQGTRFNFQFSDKLIQKDSKGSRGGLKDISIEGGTLFSTIQMLNNYGEVPNMNELIFILLNKSSVSAFNEILETPDLEKFIQMILVSYIYMYAFNPQAEQIHNEVANIMFSKENTVYFHHIDTGIIPSYILLNQTIEQLNTMLQNLEDSEETDNFIKVLIEPSESFSGQENNLLNWAYGTSDPWGQIANLIAYDTIIDIALDLFALGF